MGATRGMIPRLDPQFCRGFRSINWGRKRQLHEFQFLTEANMSNIIPFIPGLSPTTIAEEEVTPTRLSALLDMAFIDHRIDEDGDV